MDSNRPLWYPAWEYVLQYMSADTRLALSQRCPAIRNLDQRVPLKIADLTVTSCTIQVNVLKSLDEDTGSDDDESDEDDKGDEDSKVEKDKPAPSRPACSKYTLGIIKIDRRITRRGLLVADDDEGQHKDIDRYGESEEGNQRIADARIANLEQEIMAQEARVEHQRPLANTEMGERFLEAFEKKIVQLRAEIEKVRRNGYIPPFTYYLQLTSWTRFGGRKVERFEYTKPIASATKYLFEKLFPKKKLISVDSFYVRDLDVSLSEPPRTLELPNFTSDTSLNGMEAELCFTRVDHVDPVIKRILENDFEKEKVIMIGLVMHARTRVMNDIRGLPGAQLSETTGHVTFLTEKQFKVTFYMEDKGWHLHAKVERK